MSAVLGGEGEGERVMMEPPTLLGEMRDGWVATMRVDCAKEPMTPMLLWTCEWCGVDEGHPHHKPCPMSRHLRLVTTEPSA